MSNLKIYLGSLLIGSLLTVSCATMFSNDDATIMASSANNKTGIEVQIESSSGLYKTELPATITAGPSQEGVVITVTDKCYDRTETKVRKTVRGVYWVNILNGWGFLIDWLTGNMWDYRSTVTVLTDEKEKCVTSKI